jgi:hypothetical protein
MEKQPPPAPAGMRHIGPPSYCWAQLRRQPRRSRQLRQRGPQDAGSQRRMQTLQSISLPSSPNLPRYPRAPPAGTSAKYENDSVHHRFLVSLLPISLPKIHKKQKAVVVGGRAGRSAVQVMISFKSGDVQGSLYLSISTLDLRALKP